MRNEKCAAGWSAAATVGCLRRLSRGLRRDARRQHEKAFAQSERAHVGGVCEVSPPAVLVRRQPFIGPGGQGCRMGCQLHVNISSFKLPVLAPGRVIRCIDMASCEEHVLA